MDGEELYERLSASLVECSLRSGRKFFLPDVIDDEITIQNVKFAAPSGLRQFFGNPRNSFVDKIVQQTKNIFAILVMISKTDAIKALLAEEINDSLLPLTTGPDNILVSGNGKTFPSFRLWTSRSRNDFLEKQWWVLAPVVKTRGQHVVLEPSCAMPITDCKLVAFQLDCVVHQGVLHTSRHQTLTTAGTDTKVAIKDFLKGSVPFRKELDILDQILNIHHPHLIQHICSFVVGDGHFVVFPWAGGGNLRQYWEKEDRTDRTADLLVWHLQQLLGEADALRALHEINCRHGDLKPENILYFDDEKNFVVADVGLSHIHMDANMHRSLTTSSQATTPSYEAPDVITGIDSPQSRLYDIWSLGCIFLEFMVWFLFDHDSIKFFRGSRLPSNTPGKGVIWSYFYYIQENGEVIVHPVVSEVTAALRSDPRCTGDTALGAVLDLISEALLRVEVKERHAAGQVVDILRMIYERAKSEPSYCFNAVEVDPIKPTWLHAKTENLVEVASTIETSRDGYQASSTGRTYSTQPTTLANSRSSKPPLDKVMIAQNSIIEEWELTTDEPAPVPQDMGDVGDGQSTISGDSVLLNPGCRDFIIKEFSAALLRELPSKHLLLHSRFLEDPAFRQSFSAFLKIYTKAVMEGTAKHSRRRQASKAIRQLRDSILPRLQKVVSDSRDPEMPGKIPTTITRQVKNAGLEEQSWKEKCSEWQIDCNDDRIHLNETQLPRSDGPESDDSISSNEQDECEEDNPDNKDAYLYLTQHSAFSTLTRDVQKAMEQHFGNAMELIRHRVMLALRRPETIEKVTDGAFRASLRTEWDPGAFLKDQYPAVRMQPIRHTLALTGEGVDAQLTSVENYLGQVWPKHTYRLVDTINSTLVQNEGDTLSSDVCFFPDKRTVTVLGSEELIVTVAQQLAWLGAACRASTGQLAFCCTTFSEVHDSQVKFPGLVFDITYDVSSIGLEATESCWHDLVGNSVIATGFPISARDNGEVGLHVPLELMGALARIPVATRFCGGYVLKSRSVMLVPVDKKGNSIQWHLIQKHDRGRMRYHDLSILCPNRLLFDVFDEEDLSSTNCFLGWCPHIKNHLATNEYDYQSVGYSNTPGFSKRTISLTNISFGFQQWGTLALGFTLAKKDGYYHHQKSDFYVDMLDDAAQMSVVLQDMEDRRAWLTNAETMILHIILHRNTIKPMKEKGRTMGLQAGVQDDPLSVRQAMLSNQDFAIRTDKQMNGGTVTDKLYQHLVSELFTIFEGLEGVQEEIAKESGKELKLDEPNRLQGWEYLDIVNRKRRPQMRCTDLKKTCGGWPKLTRELNAISLFGVRFHEAILPEADRGFCSVFKTLPKGKDYLAMEVKKLRSLYEESGSHEHGTLAQITISGTQLQQSAHVFDPCPKISKRSKTGPHSCVCERVQQLMFKRNDANIAILQGVACSGAIIIGQGKGNTSWRDIFRDPKTNKLQAQSSWSQKCSTPSECAATKSPPISEATTVRQDTLKAVISPKSQDSTSSPLCIGTPSSLRSGHMSGRSRTRTENPIERVNGRQTLRRKPNFASSYGMGEQS